MQQFKCDLWLMEPNAMRQFVALASSDISVDLNEVRASAPQQRRQKAIAVLPVHGILEARPTFMGAILGMSSYESIGSAFDMLMADDSVSSIVLDIASPGGMAYGAPELANKIHEARGIKPIIAMVNPVAASGAYWLASAADRVVMTTSGDVGSVGVIAEHVDESEGLAKEGINVTIIRSAGSPFKGESNGVSPLTDEARQALQARADRVYEQFVGDLAKFRGTTVDHVEENFGKGRMVQAKQALSSGMVDRIWTADELLGNLSAGRVRIRSDRAQDDWDAPTESETRRNRLAAFSEIALDETTLMSQD